MPPANPVPGTFIFRPGATATRFDAGVPVYTDFLQLYADLQATEGRKVIIFDDSISSPCTIPVLSGSYIFGDTKWSGGDFSVGDNNGVVVTFAAGALVATPPVAFEGLEISLPVGVATPFVYGSNSKIPMVNCRFSTIAAGQPMFSITGTQTVFYLHNTRFAPGGGVVVAAVTGSITVSLDVTGDTLVSSGSISAPVGSIFVQSFQDTSAVIGTQAGVLGTSITTLNTDAALLKYVPGTPGDWPVVPGSVDAALDSLAAEVATAQATTVYVSKVGNDSNSGFSPTQAKLTISAAVTVATAIGFAAVVEVLDAGIYAESVLLGSSVSLNAPYAEIAATNIGLTVGVSSSAQVRRVSSTTSIAVQASGGCHIDIGEVEVFGSAVAVKLSGTGVQHVDIRQIDFSSGVGVEFTYTSFGQTYANFGRISGGTGACIQQVSGNAIGSVFCTAKRLQGSGTGILISGASMVGDYQVVVIDQATAFNVVAASSTLNVVASRVGGSTVGAGTVNVVKAI